MDVTLLVLQSARQNSLLPSFIGKETGSSAEQTTKVVVHILLMNERTSALLVCTAFSIMVRE